MLACCLIGCITLAAPLAARAAPKAPTNLVATAVSPNQIDLSWTDTANNEDGFKIERAPDVGDIPGSWTQIATAGFNATSYNDAGVSADAKYWYRVRAYNNSGDSAYSNLATAFTPLGPPSGLTTTVVSAREIDLHWTDNSSTEDGFKIERSTNGTNFTQIAQVLPNTTAYRNTALWPAAVYYYRVRTFRSSVESAFSNVATANPPSLCEASIVGWGTDLSGESRPPALTGVVAFAGSDRVSWGECGFNLALLRDGSVVGWGCNNSGQATPPTNLAGVVAISAGTDHSVALKADGTVVCWGDNYAGRATTPTNLTGVVAISAGGYHNLALKGDGTVVGWGYNSSGQTTPPSNATGLVAIAAGGYHSLALRSDGTVIGWGDNYSGKATPPAGLTGVVAIAAGENHSLALKSDGTVVGWGFNGYGGTTVPTNLTGVVAIGAGDFYSIALKSNGTVVGWGFNDNGEINIPAGLMAVQSISACYAHNLALSCTPYVPSNLAVAGVSTNRVDLTWTDRSITENGFLIERSSNGTNFAQIASLGSNVTAYSDQPLSPFTTYWYRVRAYNGAGTSIYSSVTSATTHALLPLAPTNLTAAEVSTNTINLSWVDNSNNETGFKIERAPDSGGTPGAWTQITTVAANTTSFADTGLSSNTKYWYRVRAYTPQGDSAYSNQATARTIPPPSGLVATTASINQINLSWTDNAGDESGFRIERSMDGTNFVQIAQVLPNTTSYRDTGVWPGKVYYYRVRAYNGGDDSSFSNVTSTPTPALCTTSLIAWGYNADGQSVPPAGLSGVVAVAASYAGSCALKSNGTVVCWGNQSSPPAGLTGVVAVAPGDYHCLALKADGTVVCWGNNTAGQATPPTGLSNVVAIAAGEYHSLALKSDGTIIGWGNNAFGQSTSPTGLAGVVAISAGGYHSLALKSDGTVIGWGQDISGIPDSPPAGLSNVVAVAAGGFHSLALKSDGTVVGWGWNGNGQAAVPPGLSGVVAIYAGNVHSVVFKGDGTVVGWGFGPFGQTALPDGLTGVVAFSAGGFHDLALSCAPKAPSGLTASNVASNQINLSWMDNSNNESGFVIERAADNGSGPGTWSQLASISSNVTSYSDTGLPLNATYWYRIQSINPGGASPFANQVVASTLPLPPANLTATAVSSSQINLSWTDSSSNETGFKIERAPDNAGTPGTWAQIATVSANLTNYNDTGLPAGAARWYRVRAYNAAGDTGYSNPAMAAVPLLIAPSGLTAMTISTSQIFLSWADNSSIETGFRIERAVDAGGSPGPWTQIATPGANVTNYTDSGLAANVTYWYRVRAYDSGGNSDYSEQASTFVSPPCPRFVAGWGYGSQATPPTGLVWVVSIAAGYTHSLALKSDGTVVGWGSDNWSDTIPPTNLTGVTAIAAGSAHSLALKSDGTVVGWGYGGYGQLTPPSGTTGVVAIAAGGYESLALKNNGVLVVWGDTRGVTSLTGVVAMASGNNHSLAVKTDGTVVGWGNNTAGQSTPPIGLTNVIAVAAGDSHSLALKSDGTVIGWGDNLFGQATPPVGLSGVTAIAAGSAFSLALKGDGTVVGWGDNTYGESTPPAGLTRVVAIGAGSAHGLALSLPCSLSTPSGLTATPIWPTQINLSWLDNSFDEDGFKIERAPDNGGSPGTWTQIATVTTNVTTYSDTGLSPGATFWYRIRAYNTTGDSDYSAPATTTIPFVLAPSGLTAVSMSATQVNLSWVDNSINESGFKIERAVNLGGWTQIATVISNLTAYSDMAAVDGVTNSYRVRAYNSNGDSAYSSPASATTPLASPTNLVATLVAGNQIDLSWTDRSVSEDGFKIERSIAAQQDPGPWVQIGTTSTNVTVYSDAAGLACRQTYYYRVRAFKGTGNSTFSNVGSANTGALDTDGDSVPDCWILQYFGHSTGQASDLSRATDDADGDGFSNLQELLAGSIPTNSTSALRIISLVRTGSDVRVTWITAPGRTNVVEVAASLSGNYTNISPNIISNKGTVDQTNTYLDVGAVTNAFNRFYRIRLVP